MRWFGRVTPKEGHGGEDGKWEMDVNAVVKEVGLGILRTYKNGDGRSITLEEFSSKWKGAVGDTFEGNVSLDLLAVSAYTYASGGQQKADLV